MQEANVLSEGCAISITQQMNADIVDLRDFYASRLGHATARAIGMALAGRLDRKDYRVFVILGDGEIDEGQVWEAAAAASHHQLGNLVAVLDRNGLQIDGHTEEILSLEPIKWRWRSFGWRVLTVDGHDIEEILSALQEANQNDRPTLIIAYTIKGKDVSFMEGTLSFHGKPPSDEQYVKAMSELEQLEEELHD